VSVPNLMHHSIADSRPHFAYTHYPRIPIHTTCNVMSHVYHTSIYLHICMSYMLTTFYCLILDSPFTFRVTHDDNSGSGLDVALNQDFVSKHQPPAVERFLGRLSDTLPGTKHRKNKNIHRNKALPSQTKHTLLYSVVKFLILILVASIGTKHSGFIGHFGSVAWNKAWGFHCTFPLRC